MGTAAKLFGGQCMHCIMLNKVISMRKQVDTGSEGIHKQRGQLRWEGVVSHMAILCIS